MTTATTTVPPVTVDAVRGALRRALKRQQRRAERDPAAAHARAVALRAAPQWAGPDEITVDHDGRHVNARVVPAPTVLALLAELSRPRDAEYLVLLTPCTTQELGNTLLSRLVGQEVFTVNNWELVLDQLDLRHLDPRLYSREWAWLANALYDISLGTEWRKSSTILKLDDALHRVAAARFGYEDADRLDAAALLDWTRDPARITQYTSLPEEERVGLRHALEQHIGAVATVVFRLLDRQQISDTLPLGLVFRELLDPANSSLPGVTEARIRIEERFLGAPPPSLDELRRFADNCEAALLRLMDGAEHDTAISASRRAEEILAAVGAARSPTTANSSPADSTPGSPRSANTSELSTPARRSATPRPGASKHPESATTGAATPPPPNSWALNTVRLLRWLATDQHPHHRRRRVASTWPSPRGWTVPPAPYTPPPPTTRRSAGPYQRLYTRPGTAPASTSVRPPCRRVDQCPRTPTNCSSPKTSSNGSLSPSRNSKPRSSSCSTG